VEFQRVHLSYGAFAPEDFDEDAYDKLTGEEQRASYTTAVLAMLDGTVFPILAAHGIGITWNRELSRRILLTDVDWYVPLPA
jgi:hypothetical protein